MLVTGNISCYHVRQWFYNGYEHHRFRLTAAGWLLDNRLYDGSHAAVQGAPQQ